MSDYAYEEPKRGLLMSVPIGMVKAAFFVHKHDPGRRFARGSQQWERENGFEPWPVESTAQTAARFRRYTERKPIRGIEYGWEIAHLRSWLVSNLAPESQPLGNPYRRMRARDVERRVMAYYRRHRWIERSYTVGQRAFYRWVKR